MKQLALNYKNAKIKLNKLANSKEEYTTRLEGVHSTFSTGVKVRSSDSQIQIYKLELIEKLSLIDTEINKCKEAISFFDEIIERCDNATYRLLIKPYLLKCLNYEQFENVLKRSKIQIRRSIVKAINDIEYTKEDADRTASLVILS